MRTFIAIELPPEIKDKLSRLQVQLQNSGADVKWVKAQNIHLTLKFLGDRDEKKVEQISRILEETALGQQAYLVRLFSLGAFPKITSPRVIWVGINKGDRETKEIADTLEEKIAKLGIPKEDRPFSSHITIGRTRSGLNRQRLAEDLEKLAAILDEENLEFRVEKITLYKSTLTPQGPIYNVLKEVNLKTA
jgi:2'-5' RNA ligase